MRPERNNEIDLLLRQLSRRNGVPVSEPDEQHLDADELNSYVANVLPPAARARYTEHLADCSSCRKLVAQLSAAQGPVTAPQTPSVVAPSGWKSFLASLFSPMVLRYAVPALGLIVIAVVGIGVLQRERGGSVAQLSEDASRRSLANGPGQTPAASPQYHLDSNPTETTKAVESRQGQVASTTRDDAPVAKAPADAAGAATGTAAAEPPPAPKAAAPVQNEPVTATGAADLSKAKKEQPTPATETVQVQAAAETIKRDYDKSERGVTVTPGSTVRNDIAVKNRESRPAARAGEGAGVAAGKVMSDPADSRQKSADSKDREEAAEMRSVAGRRFRKSAGVWIDTDYDSSKPITAVARGSEQYRALVADEPPIRTIAEALDGQIVVVWKGRTYRIR